VISARCKILGGTTGQRLCFERPGQLGDREAEQEELVVADRSELTPSEMEPNP
jgi:hypothetical protein